VTLPPVAVIADAHRASLAADSGAPGILRNGRRVWLCPWQDVASGTRAVNESPAVFEAALACIADRGIRQVVLLGDLTDAGQTGAAADLLRRLAHWRDRAGTVFHALPGNHDMWGTAGKHTATRVMTERGATLLTSDPRLAGAQAGAILSASLRIPGQADAMRSYAGLGFFRRPGDLHWESPFGPDDRLPARRVPMRAADGSVTHRMIDASYLIEPLPGLWLLMLDANVWVPRPGIADPTRKRAFLDPSDQGWAAVLAHRPYLAGWIADVADRARAGGKVLVALSHYPVCDPFGPSGSGLGHLGEAALARRAPPPGVAQALAAAGLTLHLAGHLHARGMAQAHGLTDVAVPSPVAWPPGFAVLHPAEGRVEQVSLADVALDPAMTVGGGAEGPATLGVFLRAQARARAVGHHLPRDFPPAVAAVLARGTLADVAAALGLPPPPGLDHGRGVDLAADWHLLRRGATPAEAAIPRGRRAAYARLSALLAGAAVPAELNPLAQVIRDLARFPPAGGPA
jgi:3',5'-cyclic AMP phosphodiesterase CpdA